MIYLVSNTKYSGDDVRHIKVCEVRYFGLNVDLNEYDALIFTSKNGVRSLKSIWSDGAGGVSVVADNGDVKVRCKTFVIGSATAKAAQKAGFKDIYIGKSANGNEFASEIAPLLNGKKVLYIAAKKRVSKLDKIISSLGIDISVIVGYENVISDLEMPPPPPNSVIIFSSPNNVKGFLYHFHWDNRWQAVAIGATTAAALQKITEPAIAENQSIQSAVEMARVCSNSYA